MNPDADQAPSTVSRRDFLTAAAAAPRPPRWCCGDDRGWRRSLGRGLDGAAPNIILFITDQERKPMHWPKGWAARNLPNRQRLVDHGLSFENAFCAAAMCSPSRATFFTGKYPAEHGVTRTLTEGGTLTVGTAVALDEQNMAKILRAAGYRVHYRGKWHMSKAPNGALPRPVDIKKYGFDGWYAPTSVATPNRRTSAAAAPTTTARSPARPSTS